MLTGLDRAGQQFLLLAAAERWFPNENEEVQISVRGDVVDGRFLETVSRVREVGVFVGYPVQLIPTRQGDVLLQPIFTLPCAVNMAAGSLDFTVAAQPPDVNESWLERAFGDPRTRRHFLQWVGLRSDLDEESEEIGPPPFLDMATAAARLASFPGSRVASPLCAQPTDAMLPLRPAERGIYNGLVVFVSHVTKYSEGALRELAQLERWPDTSFEQTSLRALFTEIVEEQPAPDGVLEPLALNEEQLLAVRDAVQRPITVITGPPGTGKSQTVAAIMASLALTGKTAVLASKNHKAIDAVEERLAALVPSGSVLTRANRRWGEGRGFDVRQAVTALLARGAVTGAMDRLRHDVERLQPNDATRRELHEQLKGIAEIECDIGECQGELDQLSAQIQIS